MASHRKQRLGNANARYAVLMLYSVGGYDLKTARAQAEREVREGRILQFPTYTQAHKALMSISRVERDRYEREVRAEQRKASALLERDHKALRSTDRPRSVLHAEGKSRKQAKREAKGAQRT